MANQPVKKKFEYEKYFSNELNSLLTYARKVANDVPTTTLTFETFLISALEREDCMLYKTINSFLTSVSIVKLHDDIMSASAADSMFHPAKEDAVVEYAPELKALFIEAQKIREEFNSKAITSDMVFLAFMRTALKDDALKKKILSTGIDDNMAYDLVKKTQETMSAISNMTPEQFENFADRVMTSVDLGDPNGDHSALTIFATPNFTIEAIPVDENGTPIGRSTSQEPKKGKSSIEFCESLNTLVKNGDIDPVIGRDKEINSITKILNRRICNNVVLVGEPGVGKTAIIYGLTQRIVDGSAPSSLCGGEVFRLNVSEMIAGTQFRGQVEQRAGALMKSLQKLDKPILFIDNIHLYINDKKNVEFDIFGEFEPIFTDKKVMVIIATTPKGFHGSFEANPDTMRRFQKLLVDSPSKEDCKKILTGILPSFEAFHNVEYAGGTVDNVLSLADRYVSDRKLPSSAIDIIDEAGSLVKIGFYDTEKIREKRQLRAQLINGLSKLSLEPHSPECLRINMDIDKLTVDIADEMKMLERCGKPTVTLDSLYTAVSEHTGIPVAKINVSEKQQLAKIDRILKENIVGQDEVIDIVSRGIKRNKVGLSQKNRPILSVMCIGTTGCGKTLLAKTLAKEIFGDEKYLVRFDMSEYSDKTSVNKLIGVGAGYVGYYDGGLLTEAVKNKRHAVILIDEIEKATDEIFNIFLQILDEGSLTDNTGNKVDFKNTILILTSNVGAKQAANEKVIGFSADGNADKKDVIEKELKNRFPPEFLNRLDEIVYFNNLTDDNLKDIVKLELNKTLNKLEEAGYSVAFSDSVADFIFEKVKPEKEYGARPIGRAIQKEIENRITDFILENDCEGQSFNVKIKDGQVDVH